MLLVGIPIGRNRIYLGRVVGSVYSGGFFIYFSFLFFLYDMLSRYQVGVYQVVYRIIITWKRT